MTKKSVRFGQKCQLFVVFSELSVSSFTPPLHPPLKGRLLNLLFERSTSDPPPPYVSLDTLPLPSVHPRPPPHSMPTVQSSVGRVRRGKTLSRPERHQQPAPLLTGGQPSSS